MCLCHKRKQAVVQRIFLCLIAAVQIIRLNAQIQTLKGWRPDFLCDSCIFPEEPEFVDFQGISQAYLLTSGFL